MLYFTKLEISNFLIIESASIDLTQKGLIQLLGVNLDRKKRSNASGKSSIIDAFVWCPFGKTIRGYSADEVINSTKKKNCSVGVSLLKDDLAVEIRRYRKHEQFKDKVFLTVDGEDKTLETNKDTQEAIENLLGVSFQAFINYVVFGQGEDRRVLRFSEMTDLQRKETIESLLPTVWIQEFHDKISSVYGSLKDELQEHMEKFNSLALDYFSSCKNINTITVPELNLELTEKTISGLDSEINALRSRRKQLESSLIEESKKIASSESVLKHTLHEIKQKVHFFVNNQECPECGSELTPEYREEKTNLLKTRFHEIKSELSGLDKKFSNLIQIEIDSTDLSISEKEKNKQRLTTQVSLFKRLNQEKLKAEKFLAEQKIKTRQIKKTLVVIRSKIDFLKNKLEILEFWVSAFSTKGSNSIRSLILDSITEYLNEQINFYLNQLSYGETTAFFTSFTQKKDKTDNRFSLNVNNTAGTPSYSGNSGGERQEIDLAILFALRDVAGLYSKLTCNVLFMDEVFRSLDNTGIENVKTLLSNLKASVPSIYVVTHVDMGDIFDSSLTVVRENNLTTVVCEQ